MFPDIFVGCFTSRNYFPIVQVRESPNMLKSHHFLQNRERIGSVLPQANLVSTYTISLFFFQHWQLSTRIYEIHTCIMFGNYSPAATPRSCNIIPEYAKGTLNGPSGHGSRIISGSPFERIQRGAYLADGYFSAWAGPCRLLRMVAATMSLHAICTGTLKDRNDAISPPLCRIRTNKRYVQFHTHDATNSVKVGISSSKCRVSGPRPPVFVSRRNMGDRNFVKVRRYTLGELETVLTSEN